MWKYRVKEYHIFARIDEHELDGIVIYAPKASDGKGKVYIPQQAVDLINGKNYK